MKEIFQLYCAHFIYIYIYIYALQNSNIFLTIAYMDALCICVVYVALCQPVTKVVDNMSVRLRKLSILHIYDTNSYVALISTHNGSLRYIYLQLLLLFQDHFKRINGTSVSLFESHLAEIIWRNHHVGANLMANYLTLIRQCYPLTEAPRPDLIPQPLFDSWEVASPQEYEEKNSIMRVEEEEDWPGDMNDMESPQSPAPHNQPPYIAAIEPINASELDFTTVNEPEHMSPATPEMSPAPSNHPSPPSTGKRRQRFSPTLRRKQRKQWTTNIGPIGTLDATQLDSTSVAEPAHMSSDTPLMSPVSTSAPTPPFTISGKRRQRSSPPLPSKQRRHCNTPKPRRPLGLMAAAMDYEIQVYDTPQPHTNARLVRPLETMDSATPKETVAQVHWHKHHSPVSTAPKHRHHSSPQPIRMGVMVGDLHTSTPTAEEPKVTKELQHTTTSQRPHIGTDRPLLTSPLHCIHGAASKKLAKKKNALRKKTVKKNRAL